MTNDKTQPSWKRVIQRSIRTMSRKISSVAATCGRAVGRLRINATAFALLALVGLCNGSTVQFCPSIEAMLEACRPFGSWCSVVQGQSGDELTHSTLTNLVADIDSPQFSNALFKVICEPRTHTTLPAYKVLVCTNCFGHGELTIDLAYRKVSTNATAIESLGDSIRWFVSTRVGGHTFEYSLDSMIELASPSLSNVLFAAEARIRKAHHIPAGWLRHSLTNSMYYVVDGGIAWVYDTTPPFLPTCEDAQELDPKVRPLLDAARDAVWQAHQGPLNSRIYYDEVKALPKRKYGIKWLSPLDLNPGMIIDFGPRKR